MPRSLRVGHQVLHCITTRTRSHQIVQRLAAEAPATVLRKRQAPCSFLRRHTPNGDPSKSIITTRINQNGSRSHRSVSYLCLGCLGRVFRAVEGHNRSHRHRPHRRHAAHTADGPSTKHVNKTEPLHITVDGFISYPAQNPS